MAHRIEIDQLAGNTQTAAKNAPRDDLRGATVYFNGASDGTMTMQVSPDHGGNWFTAVDEDGNNVTDGGVLAGPFVLAMQATSYRFSMAGHTAGTSTAWVIIPDQQPRGSH